MNPKENPAENDSDTLIAQLQGLNVKIEETMFNEFIQKAEVDATVYSKLEEALFRVETWSLLFRKQVDISREFGFPSLSAREYLPGFGRDSKYPCYYTLNAKSVLGISYKDKRFRRTTKVSKYTFLLVDHRLEESSGHDKVYGHDRFKVVINMYCNNTEESIHLSAIQGDYFKIVDDEQTSDFHTHIKNLSQNHAEKTLNLLVAMPWLLRQATESVYQIQKRKLNYLEEMNKRVSEKKIPPLF